MKSRRDETFVASVSATLTIYLFPMSNNLDKAIAEHKLYKAPLMIVRDRVAGRFMTVKMNERGDKLLEDQVFYAENLAQY